MKMVSRVMAGIVIGMCVSGMATAQKEEELTVTGLPMVETPIGINYTGLKVKDVSLSYTVNLKDLDLSTAAGVTELNRRVAAAARAACDEIGRLYPISHPDTPACAKAAVDKTLVQLRPLLGSTRPTATG